MTSWCSMTTHVCENLRHNLHRQLVRLCFCWTVATSQQIHNVRSSKYGSERLGRWLSLGMYDVASRCDWAVDSLFTVSLTRFSICDVTLLDALKCTCDDISRNIQQSLTLANLSYLFWLTCVRFFRGKMFLHSNSVLCALAKESKHSITAMTDFYGISFYKNNARQ